jgi:hypothetical protein
MTTRNVFLAVLFSMLLLASRFAAAQADLPIYTDNLVNNFQNWSWASINLENTSPVHSGSDSISVTMTAGYQALFLEYPNFNDSPYVSLSFWINGGPSGGQALNAFGLLNGNNQPPGYALGPLPANTWVHFDIPLSTLGVANATNFSGIWIQGSVGGVQPTFYVDDIRLRGAPAPALVHLGVNAALTLRTVDRRMFGLNTATWDGSLDTSQTESLLKEMGTLALRFPGGSTADNYHWSPSSVEPFADVVTNIGAQAFSTVNYGSGTAAEAAGWVKFCNVTNHYDFKYWEIGNECYGMWETDENTNAPYNAHDPWSYAMRVAGYMQQMKVADPTIKIGIVVIPGETSDSNGYTNHPATNLITGEIVYGWTPVVLATLRSLGVTPDFAVDHFYPEFTVAGDVACVESDPFLLQSSSQWPSVAADLRTQIKDYFGAGGSNIELCVTENNSDAGRQGRQSTSLVNAIYYADSLSQLMRTEFNSFIWWDLRNSADTGGSFDPTLYGWRTNGDLGMIGGLTNRYPEFYAAKLMQYFARPGGAVLEAGSDCLLLSAYAVRCTNGALALLVLNKDTAANFTTQIALTNFAPAARAIVQSYGIPQDQAAENNQNASLQDIAITNFSVTSTNFTCSFPPLSLTLFTFAPEPAKLAVIGEQPGQVVLQLQGQPGAPYVLQSSPDLAAWTSVSTNMFTESSLTITNLVLPATRQEFWRAVWRP